LCPASAENTRHSPLLLSSWNRDVFDGDVHFENTPGTILPLNGFANGFVVSGEIGKFHFKIFTREKYAVRAGF
jgi:hypothetical protein